MDRTDETVSLTLLEAIYEWCDPAVTSRFREVEDAAYDDRVNAMVANLGPDSWKVNQYYKLRETLLSELGDKVAARTLLATARDPKTPLAQAAEIPSDQWQLLDFDLRLSSARLRGFLIVDIKLTPARQQYRDQHTSTTTISSSEAASSPGHQARPATPRLVVRENACEIMFDGKRLSNNLPNRPFKVLVILATAALRGKGTVSGHEIKEQLMTTSTSERAGSDAVRDLRERLKSTDLIGMVKTHAGAGYYLDLQPEVIEVVRN